MLTDILIATNIVLVIVIILFMIKFLYRKDELKNLNEQLLDEKLKSRHASEIMLHKETQYQSILLSLGKAMKHIRHTDHEIGNVKKSLSRFYTDLVVFTMMSSEVINDKKAYRDIIDYLENDLHNFMSNKSDKLDTDKFFNILEKID